MLTRRALRPWRTVRNLPDYAQSTCGRGRYHGQVEPPAGDAALKITDSHVTPTQRAWIACVVAIVGELVAAGTQRAREVIFGSLTQLSRLSDERKTIGMLRWAV